MKSMSGTPTRYAILIPELESGETFLADEFMQGNWIHSVATYAMPTRYYAHGVAATSGLLMSVTATLGYVYADSNAAHVALGAQTAGGVLIAGIAWLDAYLKPPVSGITFQRLLRRTRAEGEDAEQLVGEIRAELDHTYRPVPDWVDPARGFRACHRRHRRRAAPLRASRSCPNGIVEQSPLERRGSVHARSLLKPCARETPGL